MTVSGGQSPLSVRGAACRRALVRTARLIARLRPDFAGARLVTVGHAAVPARSSVDASPRRRAAGFAAADRLSPHSLRQASATDSRTSRAWTWERRQRAMGDAD